MRKYRVIHVVAVLLLAAFLLVGCQSFSTVSGETITVTDHNGNKVSVPKDIQRIVVCDILPLPSVLSVFFNSAEKIVGMASTSMSAAQNSLLAELYPEIRNANTSFIEGSEVNIESLMMLAPDVVFYSASNPELGEKLRNSGFAAVAISANKWGYDCIETLNQWITIFSEMFPSNNRVEKVRTKSEEIYQFVTSRVSNLSESEKRRIFFLYNYNETTITTSGVSFFGQWWTDTVGAVNVADAIKTDKAAKVSMEQIYQWDPEMIFITNFNTAQPSDILNNTVGTYDWSAIDAVKEKRVYKMPLGMYRSYTPGVDTPITLLWLAKTVYPALFADVDVTKEAKDYYKDVFGVELTNEQVEKIFAPVSDAAGGF